MIGYVIYTLPISFMLINNTMGYIDKKFMVVSRVMKDSAWGTFRETLLRPLAGTLAVSSNASSCALPTLAYRHP